MHKQEALSVMTKLGQRLTAEGSARPLSTRRGNENVYAETYQSFVKKGLFEQIRSKYRNGGGNLS